MFQFLKRACAIAGIWVLGLVIGGALNWIGNAQGILDPVAVAVDAPELEFTTSLLNGSVVERVPFDPYDTTTLCLRSGSISTKVVGPGVLHFDWRFLGLDPMLPHFGPPLEFWMDGVMRARISTAELASQSFEAPPGEHEFLWTMDPLGLGGGWTGVACINRIWFRVLPEATPIGGRGERLRVPEGLPVLLGFPLRMTPKSARWLKDGAPIEGARDEQLRIESPAPGNYVLEISDGSRVWQSPAHSVELLPKLLLQDALGLRVDQVKTGGAAAWEVRWAGPPPPAGPAVWCASPRHLPAGGDSWLEASIAGPGVLPKTWRKLQLEADGVVINDAVEELIIPEGTHTLRWTYRQLPNFPDPGDRPDAILQNLALKPIGAVVPPTVRLATNAVRVYLNDPLRVDAIVAGNPPPEVRWIHNGAVVSRSHFNASLVFPSVPLDAQGEWNVEVETSAGVDRYPFRITVLESPLDSIRIPGMPGGLVSALCVHSSGAIYFSQNGALYRVLDGQATRLRNLFRSAAGGSSLSPLVSSMSGLPDGRILVSGIFDRYGDSAVSRVVILHPSGELDTTFRPTSESLQLLRLARFCVAMPLSDGRIFVNQGLPDSRTANLATVLHLDGSRDTNFTAAPSDWAGSSTTLPYAMQSIAELSGGRVLLGSAWFGSRNLSFARLDSKGRFLGNDPVSLLPASSSGTRYPLVSSILVYPDDSYLLGGLFKLEPNAVGFRGVLKVRADGSLDSEFGREIRGDVSSLFPLANGAVLVGNFPVGSLSLLKPDGTVDSSFRSRPGKTLGIFRVDALAVNPGGFILAAGPERPVSLKGNSVGAFFPGEFQIELEGMGVLVRQGFSPRPYAIEQTVDFLTWNKVGWGRGWTALPSMPLLLPQSSNRQFYRMKSME